MNIVDIANIGNLNSVRFPQSTSILNELPQTEPDFGPIMEAAVRLFDETSMAEHEATRWQLDFASGVTDDFLGVILAERRASTAVTFTTQITSRLMDSYRQIMQLQI